jgi:uncharacterized protein
MIIVIHSSKTMRKSEFTSGQKLREPELLHKSIQLATSLKKLSKKRLEQIMKISPRLAASTHELTRDWTVDPQYQRLAIDSFIGDIYSGLQVQSWSMEDRLYADRHLRILSGLYGVIRPLDGVFPYRYEMGYSFPGKSHASLYTYWGESIATTFSSDTLVNLAAVEYSKAVLPYLSHTKIITPRFLTVNPKTRQPKFVVVHAKIARGSFACWMIQARISDVRSLMNFNELGYSYSAELSSANEPVFVCEEFKGLGLSVRLT